MGTRHKKLFDSRLEMLLEKSLHDRIGERAAEAEMSISQFTRECVKETLDRMDDADRKRRARQAQSANDVEDGMIQGHG